MMSAFKLKLCHVRISLACVFRNLFKAPTDNLLRRILFEVCPFLVAYCVFCRFLFQTKLASFNEIPQNVNDLVFRDKVE